MHPTRFAQRSLVASLAAFLTCASATAALPSRPRLAIEPAAVAEPAVTPAALPAPKVSPNRAMVTSLREIGRVRATTHFCSSLRGDTELAANAAVAFEVGALATMRDLVAFTNPPNRLVKARLERKLDDDLRNLADLSRTGGTELSHLRDLAGTATPDERRAVLGLHDALDGAKSRQHSMVKLLATVVGTYDEVDPASTIDSDEGAFVTLEGARTHVRNGNLSELDLAPGGSFDTSPSDLLGGGDFVSILDAGERYANLLPDDDRIRSDLATAAARAMHAVDLGNCADGNAAAALLPPLPGSAAPDAIRP